MSIQRELSETLELIELEYGIDGWHGEDGVTPRTYTLYRNDEVGRLDYMESPIATPGVWNNVRPGQLLASLADALKLLPAGHPPYLDNWAMLPTWRGLAIAMETWIVDDDKCTVEERQKRLLHKSPHRRTGRLVVGILGSGRHDSVKRDEGEETVSHSQSCTGEVIDGLRRLVRATDKVIASALNGEST